MSKTTKTADEVARELGFDPASNFVTVTDRGEVGFTSGKPGEIEELAFRAVKAGYQITLGLGKAAGFNTAKIKSIREMPETRKVLEELEGLS